MTDRTYQILLVAETRTANVMRQIALEGAGYSVVAAQKIPAALEALERSRFDLAVIDGSEPLADLRQLLLALRSSAVPSLLVVPPDGDETLKSLASAAIPSNDAFSLMQMVESLLREPPQM
jgi:CheY-like chemotaxis protein